MNRRTPLPPLLRGLNPDMQLLIDDPVAKRHAAALIAFERNRSVSFDEYMSAVSFFFHIDIQPSYSASGLSKCHCCFN